MSDQAALKEQLNIWFTEQGFRPKHLRWEHNSTNGSGRVVFATTKNNYFAVFNNNYLGLIVSSRVIRPGETWSRGNDLPDGKFSKEVFDAMMGAVVLYELRELSDTEGPPPWIMEKT